MPSRKHENKRRVSAQPSTLPTQGISQHVEETHTNSHHDTTVATPRSQQVVEAHENATITDVRLIQIGSLTLHVFPANVLAKIALLLPFALMIAVAVAFYLSIGLWAGILFGLGSTWISCLYLSYKQLSSSKEKADRLSRRSQPLVRIGCYMLPILIAGWFGYNWCNITWCTSKAVLPFASRAEVWIGVLVAVITTWLVYAYSQFIGINPLKIPRLRIWRQAIIGRWVLAGLCIISSVSTGGAGYYWASPKIIILVANFDGPDPQRYRVTDIVLSRLRTTLEGYDNVEVVALGRSITEVEGSAAARIEGSRRKAAMIFWGGYGDTTTASLNLHVEVLCPLACDPQLGQEAKGKLRLQPVTDLENMTLQTNLSVEMSYLSLFVVGMVRYTGHDWKGAITTLGEALDLTQERIPSYDQTKIYYFRVLAFLALNDHDSAISDLDQVLRLDPTATWALTYRAGFYSDKLDYERALKDVNEAIRLQPNYAMAYSVRSLIYTNQGKHDEAIADLDYAIKLEPTNASFYLNRGIAYSEKGDLDQAIAEFSHGMQFDINEGELFFERGYNYFLKDENDQAITDLNQAINLMPKDPRPYFIRGTIDLKKDDYDQAIDDLTKAIERRPNDGREYMPRALAYLKKGNTNQAIADLKRYLELPASEKENGKQQAEEMLRKLESR